MKRHFLGIALLSLTVLSACGNNTAQQGDAHDATGQTADTTSKSQAAASEATTTLQSSAAIPFTPVEHHFVKNTYKQGALQNPKIEDAKQFEAIFGVAATMNNKPTQVDFTKQYVIAVIGKETDITTAIKPLSLQKQSNGDIVLTYEVKQEGGPQSYKIMPFLAIAVDKSHTGKVIVQQK